MKRKWQRVLSWILTLTMLLGTFQGTGFSVFAGDDEDVTISDDTVLDGDLEDIEEPEDPIDLALAEVTMDLGDSIEDWGIWDKDTQELIIYPGKSVIAAFNFGANLDANTDIPGNVEWSVAFGTTTPFVNADYVSLAGTTATAPYDTTDGFKFYSVVTEGNTEENKTKADGDTTYVQMIGTPTDTLEKTSVSIKAELAGVTKTYDFKVSVANIDRNLYIEAIDDKNDTDDYENPIEFAVYNWDNTGAPMSNTLGEGHLETFLGKGAIGDIDFQTFKGPESLKAPADRTGYTNLQWELWTSTKALNDENVEIDVPAEKVFELTEGHEDYLNGLKFKHMNGEGTQGILRINGTPNATLADNTLYFLRAHSLEEGDKTTAQEWADFKLYITINELDPSVSVKEDKEGAQWSAPYTIDGGLAAVATPFKEARTGYTVEESSNPNAIPALKYALTNTSTIMDITNVKLELVKHPEAADADPDESDLFNLSYSFDTMELGGAGNAVYKFSVTPDSGLVARPEPYKAAVLLTGDQLPADGIIVAKFIFKVNPVFEMKVNGESRELTPVKGGEPFYKEGTNRYFFDINTYEAGKIITNGITFNVVSKEEGKTVWFLPYNKYGTVEGNLPLGLILGSAGSDTMKVTGYLDPTTWNEADCAPWIDPLDVVLEGEDLNIPTPYYEYDNLTGNVIYYIPFPVIDSDDNVITYIGKLTVEPCDISLATGASGSEELVVEDMTAKTHTTTWFASEDYDQKANVQEIKITNNGDKKITLTASLTEGDFVLLKAADSFDAETDAPILATDEERTLEIEAGASGSWFVAPVEGKEKNTTTSGKIHIVGYADAWAAEADDIQIDDLLVNLKFKVYDGFTIVAPEGDNAAKNGKTYANAREITIGIGEAHTWDLKAVGNTGKVTWSTTPKGTDIGDAKKVGEHDGEDYRATTSELANDYNFSITSTGILRTSGAEKEGTFTICVSAKDTVTTIYSYYIIHVVKSDIILTATVPDEVTGTKVLKSSDAEEAYVGEDLRNYDKYSETRNLTVKTSEDGIHTLPTVVTLTNSGKVDLTDVTVTMGVAYKDDTLPAIQDENDPFTAFDEDNIIEIGTIAKDGGTATFEIVVKALHYNDAKAGKYLVPIKITSGETVDQQFEVLLTVTKAPVINPVKTDAAKSIDSTNVYPYLSGNRYVEDATQLSYYFNSEYLANAELEKRDATVADRTQMKPYTANLVNDTSNIIIGEKVAVGQEFSIQLSARDTNGKLFKKGEANFDWEKTLDSDFDIPSSITITKDGLIEGKPLVAGTYYMRVRVQDIRNTAEITEGYYDICIYVPGAANAQITISDVDVKDTKAVKDYLTFKGAVKGDALDETFAKDFIVKNKTKDVAIAGLAVSVKDDPTLPGGAAHFTATLADTAVASGGDKFTHLTVAPKDTTTAGVYKAYVVVTADNINPIQIPVFWVVTERLTFVRPDASQTITRTGMLDFELGFTATGAGNYYKIVDGEEVLQTTDSLWYTSKDANLDLSQYAVWSIGASEGHADDSELIAMLKGLRECDINRDAFKEEIKNKRINIALDGNINAFEQLTDVDGRIGGSRARWLTSDQLTGGGTYSMEVFVTVAAVKNALGTVVLPAQERSEIITLTITPTNDVYAKALYDDWSGSVTDTATVKEHYDISGSTKPARKIAEYEKDLGFNFRGMPVGYTAEERPAVEFFALNEIASKLRIKASVVSANKTDASSAFVIVADEKEWTTYETTKKEDEAQFYNLTKYNGAQGFYPFVVTIAKDLPASETPYEGYLLIEGTGIKTIEIPLSVVVSAKDYKIGVYAYQTKAETGALQGEGEVFDAKPINVKDQPEDGPSKAIGYLNVFGVGNMDAKALRIVELDENGDELGLGAKKKLNYTFLPANAAAKIIAQDKPIKVATDVNAPSINDDQHSVIELKVTEGNKVVADTVSMNVYYEDPSAPTKERYVTITVNYVVYAHPVNVEIKPDGNNLEMGRVSEGYVVSENTIEFTVTNKETGDASKGLYKLDASLEPKDLFRIVTTHKDTDVVLPGETASFVIEPIENIPAGEYTVTVTFNADNMEKAQKRTVLFKVTKSDTFNTYFTNEGWTLEGGFKTRLLNTLANLDTDGSTYLVKWVGNDDDAAYDNYKYYQSCPKGYYLIDLNDIGNTWDVVVYEDKDDILTVRKVNSYDIYDDVKEAYSKDNCCNVVKYTSPLTYAGYTAANNTFKTMNFNLLETVQEVGYTLDGSFGVIVDGVDYGYVKITYDPVEDALVYNKAFKEFVEKYKNYIAVREDEDVEGKYYVYIYARFLVPYNDKLGNAKEHISYKSALVEGAHFDRGYDFVDIAYYQKDTYFEGWNNVNHENGVEDFHLINASTVITEDKRAIPLWHTHKFYQEEDSMTVIGNVDQYVEWKWEGSAETGFTGATVTLYCWDPNGCPDPDKGAKTLTAIVTPVKVDGTCTTGGHTEYRAEAQIPVEDIGFNGVLYVSENKALYEEGGYGHVYEYNWDKVTWYNTEGKMEDVYATVVKTCVSKFHRIDEDGDYAVTVSANKLDFVGKKATCSENGSGYYVATFDFDDVPAADKEAGKNVVSQNAPVVLATGHNWAVVSADWVGNYKEGAKSATLHLVCQNDETHTFDLLVTDDGITLLEETETYKKYRALGEKDGQALTAEVTFSSHTEHNWIVSWNWAAFDGKSGTGTVDVTFTCTNPDGGEVLTQTGLIPEKIAATEYSATYKVTAKDADGVEYSDTKTYDLESGNEIGHTDHKWSEPVWDWTGTGRETAKAKATFNCTVVSENHSVVVEATKDQITRKEVGKNKVVYTATVSGPDAKNYTSKCTVKWTVNDDGTISENIIPGGSATGIGIEGLDPDDEFEFTGNAIKPVFQVVDYDRDVVLAETTDYTLKWKDNKKVGTATVTVEGKGNYTGKTVSTTFKIVAPDTTADEIVTSVKSVKVSKDKFVYDGTAKYPATITVKTKDAGTIVLTYKDGEYESSVDGKTVALTFSNNVNKGKATVAATGKDGKTKKKTFSIAAADLKTLGDALTMEAGNGVYAVKAPVPSSLDVEYNDMTLVLGQDFKATYAYANKKSKNAGEKAGVVKITGKGNYKGKVEVLFDVDAFELEDEKVAVAAAPKAKSAKLKASVADANGVLIPAKQLVVTCVGAKGKKLAAGDEIEVTVKGANESNISGEVKLSIKVGAADLKKAKVTGLSGKSKYTVEYTGTPIDFEEMEENPFESGKIALTGYIYGEDYEIAGYLNNNKKGTMTVILRGISEKVSGVKTLKIKVTAKQMKPAE